MNGPELLQEQKSFLRKELRRKLRTLKPEERTRRSEKVVKELFGHPKFSKARSLLVYVAMEHEVETRPLLEEAWRRRKKVYVPRLDSQKKRIQIVELSDLKELKPGSYGILEPPLNRNRLGKPEELDLAIVPGLGFDRGGGRLGRGFGYFDRFLFEARKAYKIGLAFECQIVDEIPRDVHDVVMDEVLIG